MAMKLKPKPTKHPNGSVQKARKVRLNVNGLFTVFFDFNDVVDRKVLPQVRTVNKEYYLEMRRRLQETIYQLGKELWKNRSWILHNANALAHISILVREVLTKNKTVIMPPKHCIHPTLPPPTFSYAQN